MPPPTEAADVERRLSDARSKLDQVSAELFRSFPSNEAWLLPTRLGNAIRAFETYPMTVYGGDGVPLWPRLLTVIPSDFCRTLDDARAEVNFLANMVLVATPLAVATVARWEAGIRWAAPTAAAPAPDLGWMFAQAHGVFLVAAALLLLAAWGFYRWTVLQAKAWGELVRTAFDCYLPDLAKKLGYALPQQGQRQRDFWGDIAGQAVYGDPFEPSSWPRAAAHDGQ